MSKIFAIEGLVHAGKTTLFSSLKSTMKNVFFIDEYNLFRRGRDFPAFPIRLSEALSANNFFLEIDRIRFKNVDGKSKIVLDRSLFSVLAYQYATEKITRGRIACFTPSCECIERDFFHFLPKTLIYLKISTEELTERHKYVNGFYKPILLDKRFNEYLIEFYLNLNKVFPWVNIHEIDGTLAKAKVVKKAFCIIGENSI